MGINKDLGLPFGDGMEKVAVCFDVDGTLINGESEAMSEARSLLAFFVAQKWKNVRIIVWSGGGADYARTIIRSILPGIEDKLLFYSKLEHEKLKKRYQKIIAIDDVQDTRLGDVNLIVRNK